MRSDGIRQYPEGEWNPIERMAMVFERAPEHGGGGNTARTGLVKVKVEAEGE